MCRTVCQHTNELCNTYSYFVFILAFYYTDDKQTCEEYDVMMTAEISEEESGKQSKKNFFHSIVGSLG